MEENKKQPKGQFDGMVIRDEKGEYVILEDGQLKPLSSVDEPAGPSATAMVQAPASQVPAIYNNKASFYFHPDDEEEVSKLPVPAGALPQKKYSLEKIVYKIIELNGLTLLNDQLKARLSSAAYAFLRDRRSLVATQELLVSDPGLAGGLGFEAGTAEAVIDFLKEVKDKITKENGLVVEEPSLPPEAAKEPIAEKPITPTAAPITPIQEPLSQIPVQPPAEPKLPAQPPVEMPPLSSLVKPAFKPQRSVKEGKVPVADVRKEFKLVGPLEELAQLSLITFRRLGPDTVTQAKRVLDKVNRLGTESISKKAAGIKAWRACPLYKLYLTLGQQSMEQSLPVNEIISACQQQGQETMTLQEFEVISDLNKHLRF